MSPRYPEERKKLDVIAHLEELRRRILICLAALLFTGTLSFWKGGAIMALVQRPIEGFVDELIFISPTEAFVAYIKVALLFGFIVSFPVILYQLWAFISPALSKRKRSRMIIWLAFSLALFLTGILFSYFVAIPAALSFLLKFSSGIAVAKITLGKYISFFGALVLVGGITFEIPIIIGFLVDVGLLSTGVLRRKRHYAILIIMVFAAVITPTQDILNMLLFAIPMIVLYEVGILIGAVLEKSS